MSHKPEPLTKRETDTLKAIEKYIANHGYGPSFRELTQLIGLKSTSNTFWYVKKLQDKGYLDSAPRMQTRSLRVLKSPTSKRPPRTKEEATTWIAQTLSRTDVNVAVGEGDTVDLHWPDGTGYSLRVEPTISIEWMQKSA